jgi:hypothetical protein
VYPAAPFVALENSLDLVSFQFCPRFIHDIEQSKRLFPSRFSLDWRHVAFRGDRGDVPHFVAVRVAADAVQ